MRYLFDTNACLDFILQRNANLIERTRTRVQTICVSAITAAELRVGARISGREADEDRLDLFFAAIAVRPFDEEAAATYGEMIRRIGMRRGSFDRLIAAHALTLRLILVTNNTRDFANIPGLIVENWAQ